MMLHYIHTYQHRKGPKNITKKGLQEWGPKIRGQGKKETRRKIVKIVVISFVFFNSSFESILGRPFSKHFCQKRVKLSNVLVKVLWFAFRRLMGIFSTSLVYMKSKRNMHHSQ